MVVFLILSLLLILPGIKIAPSGKIREDYISKNQTLAINGLFTLLVFLSHVSTYIKLEGAVDTYYSQFKSYMLQAVVVPFLFYSGYGIMESIKKKGRDYVKQIPEKRFFRVLLHFDIAVALYIVVNYAFGKTYSIRHILLSLVGYSSVGNSNWYIFAVLGLYVITFAAFMISGRSNLIGVILTTVLSVGFVSGQIIMKRDTWCYDTIILFSVGMIFSLAKPFAEKILSKHALVYYGVFVISAALYLLFYKKRSGGIEFYSMWAIMFMALIVLVTMKVKIGNKVLDFFGAHLFSIYILQRIPMIVFSKLGLAGENKYLFVVLCFVITVILALIFDKITSKLDKVLIDRK